MQPTLGLPSFVVTASSLTPSRGRACPAAPRRGHVPCASSRVRRSARPVEGAAAPRLLGWSPLCLSLHGSLGRKQRCFCSCSTSVPFLTDHPPAPGFRKED